MPQSRKSASTLLTEHLMNDDSLFTDTSLNQFGMSNRENNVITMSDDEYDTYFNARRSDRNPRLTYAR